MFVRYRRHVETDGGDGLRTGPVEQIVIDVERAVSKGTHQLHGWQRGLQANGAKQHRHLYVIGFATDDAQQRTLSALQISRRFGSDRRGRGRGRAELGLDGGCREGHGRHGRHVDSAFGPEVRAQHQAIAQEVEPAWHAGGAREDRDERIGGKFWCAVPAHLAQSIFDVGAGLHQVQ